MYHVSILGLGLIGSRIARHMTGLGDKVTVWNRTPREDFPEAVPTPADAARAAMRATKAAGGSQPKASTTTSPGTASAWSSGP